ncbi:MAG: LamG domain-containing protein [Candidatus Acidiferrum sp.]
MAGFSPKKRFLTPVEFFFALLATVLLLTILSYVATIAIAIHIAATPDYLAIPPRIISFPSSSALDLGTSSFTIAVAMKANSLPATQQNFAAQLLGRQAADESKGWAVYFLDDGGSGKVSLYLNDGLGHKDIYVNPTTLSLGVWYQAMFVVDRSSNTLQSYVNGVDDGATPSIAGYENFDSKNPEYIGVERSDRLSSFDGTILYAQVFKRAYSPVEVRAFYNKNQAIIETLK